MIGGAHRQSVLLNSNEDLKLRLTCFLPITFGESLIITILLWFNFLQPEPPEFPQANLQPAAGMHCLFLLHWALVCVKPSTKAELIIPMANVQCLVYSKKFPFLDVYDNVHQCFGTYLGLHPRRLFHPSFVQVLSLKPSVDSAACHPLLMTHLPCQIRSKSLFDHFL